MATKTLIEKIAGLPPDKVTEVEKLVDSLETERSATAPSTLRTSRLPPGLLQRIDSRREELFTEHGTYDTVRLIREFRETGR